MARWEMLRWEMIVGSVGWVGDWLCNGRTRVVYVARKLSPAICMRTVAAEPLCFVHLKL